MTLFSSYLSLERVYVLLQFTLFVLHKETSNWNFSNIPLHVLTHPQIKKFNNYARRQLFKDFESELSDFNLIQMVNFVTWNKQGWLNW